MQAIERSAVWLRGGVAQPAASIGAAQPTHDDEAMLNFTSLRKSSGAALPASSGGAAQSVAWPIKLFVSQCREKNDTHHTTHTTNSPHHATHNAT